MSKNTSATPNSQVSVALPTVEEYLAGDRSARAKFRAACDAAMKAALGAGDLPGAVAANARLDEFKSAAGSTPDKVTIDWAQVTADRIATLRAAADLLAQAEVRIDGTPDDYAWPANLPTGTPDADQARTIATKRATKAGPTHNVAEGVRAAFADEPDGTFLTIAEIGRRWVAAGGPTNNSGRIAARLFADVCTIDGVTPVQATTDAPRGAKKVGDWS